jgi:hypothetical protein
MPMPRASSAEKISLSNRVRLLIELLTVAWADALEADEKTEVSECYSNSDQYSRSPCRDHGDN